MPTRESKTSIGLDDKIKDELVELLYNIGLGKKLNSWDDFFLYIIGLLKDEHKKN